MPSGMTSREVENGSKIPNMIYLESTGLRISASLANKHKQKYGLFAKFSLSVIGACEVANNPHIFLTIANQNIHEINRQFDGTLNHFCIMAFSENQEQNEYYTFKDILLQPYKSYSIISIIYEVEAHEARSHWTLMKNIEVNNKRKNQ